ncbi:hypothetical protein B7463_g2358, partial [Scytalidium lignicola]
MQFLSGILAFSPLVSAIAFYDLEPTPSSNAFKPCIQCQRPQPTQGPNYKELVRRQASTSLTPIEGPDRVCGYKFGQSESPLVGLCGATSRCGYATADGQDGEIYCFGTTASAPRPPWTSCIGGVGATSCLADSACSNNPGILVCTSTASHCNVGTFIGLGVKAVWCGDILYSGTVPVSTTYPGQIGRSFTHPGSESTITSSPPSTTSTTVPPPPQPKSQNHTGAIVGGTVGGVAAIAGLITGIWFFCIRKKRKNAQPTSQEPPNPSLLPQQPPSDFNPYLQSPAEKYGTTAQTAYAPQPQQPYSSPMSQVQSLASPVQHQPSCKSELSAESPTRSPSSPLLNTVPTVLEMMGFATILVLAILLGPHDEQSQQPPRVVSDNAGEYKDVIAIEIGDTYSRVALINSILDVYVPAHILGQNFSDPRLQHTIESLQYTVIENDSKPVIEVRTGTSKEIIAPEEVLFHLVKRLKTIAEDYFGHNVQYAVMTVPFCFDKSQIEATKKAAELAGLKVFRLLIEPIAAGLAYGLGDFSNNVGWDEWYVLFFNIEPATLDICLMTVDTGVFEIISTASDHTVSEDVNETQLFKRMLDLIAGVLEKGETEKRRINGVILNGDPEYVAKIRSTVSNLFEGKKFYDEIPSNEAIVHGAAMHTEVFFSEPDIPNFIFYGIVPLSVGVETSGEVFTTIVHRNYMIPIWRARNFTTVMDNQTEINLRIFEGERQIAGKNRFLGQITLSGIQAAPKGVPNIEVAVEIDAENKLTIIAREEKNKKEGKFVKIYDLGSYSDELVSEFILDVENHRDDLQVIEAKAANQVGIKRQLDGVMLKIQELKEGIVGSIRLLMISSERLIYTSFSAIMSS